MLNSRPVLWMLLSVGVLTGCQSFTGFDFDSDAIVGGGAVAGKDYITGLKPSLKAREYFVKSNANASQKKTVTPGDDQGTGVVWTDDGGIIIPPGCSIEFENKGYCLDPHLPIPGAGHEMQFVRIASLLPDELQGTYRNLLKRSAAGDEDVKNNMQRLVWALRTAGSLDVMATHLTDRQREILSECAEDGSFEDFVYRHELYGKIVEELKSKFINKIKDKTSVNVGGVVYDALDLLNPDTGKQKVEAHLQSLISMGLNLPVTQTGFNYGELENGIFTDIKGNGLLSFKAKIANSTSQPYTFYPMNYAAQVGSGGSSVGFYAAANSGMCQRGTCSVPEKGEVTRKIQYNNDCVVDWQTLSCEERRLLLANALMAEIAYDDDAEFLVVGDMTQVSFGSASLELGIDVNKMLLDLKKVSDTDNGLSISLFKDSDGMYTIAIRGTDDLSDLNTDMAVWLGADVAEMQHISDIVGAIADASGKPVNITGHSLGGYLGIHAALRNSKKVNHIYTFNSPGIDTRVYNFFSETIRKTVAQKTTNLWHSNDFVHTVNNSWTGDSYALDGSGFIGKKIEIRDYAGWYDRVKQVAASLTGFGATWYDHSIRTLINRMSANMGNCSR